MIKVSKPGNGIYAPIISCDFCGKPIDDGKGNFLWNPDGEEDITEIYFTHKKCDNSMERVLRERGVTTMYQDLDLFLLWLVSNTKVDLKRAKEDHKLLKDFGMAS